jgi:hypothetical protein
MNDSFRSPDVMNDSFMTSRPGAGQSASPAVVSAFWALIPKPTP